jgi:large subunit ribosomal protein L18
MKTTEKKTEKRNRIKRKIRMKVFGTASKPRLSVFRSNVHIYAQIINDELGVTIASASDIKGLTGTKAEKAVKVGELIAKAGASKGIKNVIFDRNGFRYTGRIKTLADSARENGLSF